jgi:hypothetical protein
MSGNGKVEKSNRLSAREIPGRIKIKVKNLGKYLVWPYSGYSGIMKRSHLAGLEVGSFG